MPNVGLFFTVLGHISIMFFLEDVCVCVSLFNEVETMWTGNFY